MMLSRMIIGRAVMQNQSIDLHKHATFRCSWAKFWRNIGNIFS